jgi:hypothetical protein
MYAGSSGRRTPLQPRKTHTVISETEGGKTWFALMAGADELNLGNHVIYIDFEDDEGTVANRLLALQVDRAALAGRFHYIRPEHPLEGRHLEGQPRGRPTGRLTEPRGCMNPGRYSQTSWRDRRGVRFRR